MTTPPLHTAHTEPPHGPHVQPRIENAFQSIAGIWDVGEPDHEGFRAQTTLVVLFTGASYWVHLSVGAVRREGDHSRTVIDGGPLPSTILNEVDGKTRFHRGTLNNLFTMSLAEVQRRFDDGDPVIRSYFDPASDRHRRDTEPPARQPAQPLLRRHPNGSR